MDSISDKKKQKIVAAAALIITALLTALVVWKVGIPVVKFAGDPQAFRAWVESKGVVGVLAFVGMEILQVVIALLPGEFFEIAAGYAFGAVEGTVLCFISCAIGSMLVYLLVRTFGMWLVEVFFSREKLEKIRFLQTDEKKTILFLIIFMIPGTPKDLLSYFAGLTDMKPVVWLLICSVGRLPSIITSTVGGDAIGTQNYGFAAAVFIITMVISLGGILLYNRLCKRHNERKENNGN